MKKSMSLFLAVILLLTLFCSCTKQESIDAYEYCKRYNSAFDKNKINYQDFFREDKDQSCYYSFIDIAGKTALVTISVNEDSSVTGVALTITAENNNFRDEELKQCFQVYTELSATLSRNEVESMKEIMTQCEISENDIAFNDISYSAEKDNLKFTLLENSEIITMYTDKITN